MLRFRAKINEPRHVLVLSIKGDPMHEVMCVPFTRRTSHTRMFKLFSNINKFRFSDKPQKKKSIIFVDCNSKNPKYFRSSLLLD